MRRAGLTLLALLACAGMVSCGDDDNGGGGATSAADTVASQLTFVLTGRELTVDGEPRAGLTEITFRNDGRGQHEAQLVRVEGEQSDAAVLRQFTATGEGAPTPDWLRAAGGAGPAAAGAEATSTQVLEPGTYYAVDTSGGRSPAYVRFEVTGEAGDAQLPATGATITARDFLFEASGLRAGVNEVTFDNVGREIHHVIAFPLAEGRSAADFRRFIVTDGRGGGPPPVDFDRGTASSAFDGGTSGNVQLRLVSGRYVLVCFISNRAGGPPHALMGMIDEVTVE
jgi:plastocyanin